MVGREIIVMTWKEIQSSNDFLQDVKSYIEKKFCKVYGVSENTKEPVFQLPDGNKMKIITMHGSGFECLIMNYKSDFDDDDGDQFYPDDYSSPDEMFSAMLEETRR